MDHVVKEIFIRGWGKVRQRWLIQVGSGVDHRETELECGESPVTGQTGSQWGLKKTECSSYKHRSPMAAMGSDLPRLNTFNIRIWPLSRGFWSLKS